MVRFFFSNWLGMSQILTWTAQDGPLWVSWAGANLEFTNSYYCLGIIIPFVVNRNVPGLFECQLMSFVSLLFCGPEDSSLPSIFRQQSYQGFFKFGNPTLRHGQAVNTVMESYSQGEEVNHWSCRPCLLTNFEQEPANLSPKRYYNSMNLWFYSSDWSKLNPLLLSWPSSSWSWGSIQGHLTKELRIPLVRRQLQ